MVPLIETELHIQSCWVAHLLVFLTVTARLDVDSVLLLRSRGQE
jgi:hypothetical protein